MAQFQPLFTFNKTLSMEVTSLYSVLGVHQSTNSEATTDKIKSATLNIFKVDEKDFVSPRRNRDFVDSRICYANQCLRRTRLSKLRIGKTIKRDHATIIHYEYVHENLYGTNKKYTQKYDAVSSLLEGVMLVATCRNVVKPKELPELTNGFLFTIKKTLSSVTGVDRDDVLAINKMKGNGLYIYMVYDFLRGKGYTNRQIAYFMGRQHYSVSIGMSRLEDQMQFDESLRLDRAEVHRLLERDWK